MRRLSVFFFSFFLCTTVFAARPNVDDFQNQLCQIADQQLRKTLENSIVSGLIETPEDFAAAVLKAENRANNQSAVYYSARGTSYITEIRREIEKIAKPIDSLDRDALKVEKNDNYKEDRPDFQFLFNDVGVAIPKSYDLAYELCEKFNPKSGTNDAGRLDKDIDRFLEAIANDPVIRHALSSTRTTIEDLKKNWFGSGLGFEHVVAGELKGSKVSGYHWWYRFYRDEREGLAEVLSSASDVGNDSIFTGSFYWDPDGKEGPLPRAKKPKGGFCNGNSVQAMLAIGHIAIETAKKYGSVPGAMTFFADINGETFTWQLYTMGGNIRSLYPMGKGKVHVTYTRSDCFDEEFFELENDLVDSSTETVH